MTQTSHSTEALARKHARRQGRDLVWVVEVPHGHFDSGTTQWRVFTSRPDLGPHDTVLYQGPGYACPKEVA